MFAKCFDLSLTCIFVDYGYLKKLEIQRIKVKTERFILKLKKRSKIRLTFLYWFDSIKMSMKHSSYIPGNKVWEFLRDDRKLSYYEWIAALVYIYTLIGVFYLKHMFTQNDVMCFIIFGEEGNNRLVV